MHNQPFIKSIVSLTIVAQLISYGPAVGESIDDKYSHIAPGQKMSGGEHIHGASYGKLLMRVLVFGAVDSQGIHYYPEGTDLLFALLYVGGYGENSKWNGITIRRKNMKELMVIDLEDLFEEGREIPKLAEGDIVSVPYGYRQYMQDITMWTGFISAMAGFTIAVVALTRQN